MSFFDDVGNALSYTSPATYLLKDAMSRTNSPTDPGHPSPDTFIPYNTNTQGVADLINPIYNTEGARNYANTFDTAYQNLGQPLHDNSNRNDVYVGGTRALASAFADRVHQQTGYLPTADQVKQFVAQNLTPAFAQKFIVGLAPDQINSIADDYIKGNPDALVNPGIQGAQQSAEQQRLSGLKDQLDNIYNTGEQNLVSNYDTTVYNPAKTTATNDLAGQGLLTNPNSRFTLDNIDANRGRDISSGLNTLESNRAAGNIDISKTIEGLLQEDANRNQNAYQFNKTFNAAQANTAFNQNLQNNGINLASLIGKYQAQNSQKGPLDYLNAGLNVIGTGAKVYSSLYPGGV